MAPCVTSGWTARWGAAGGLPGRLGDCKQIFDLDFFTVSLVTQADASRRRENGEGRRLRERAGLVKRGIFLYSVKGFSILK